MHKVTLNNEVKYISENDDVNLLLSMQKKGFNVKVGCTVGLCEVCKLKIKKGKENLIEINDNIFTLEEDEILPCCYQIKGDIELES